MHFQRPPQNWTDVLPRLPDGALLKSFDAGVLREAKVLWAALGRNPAQLITCYRHFDLEYFFSTDRQACQDAWRRNFARFVDRTYLEQYATHVDLVETLNEHTDTRMVADAALLAPHLATEQAAVEVWNDRYRGQLVRSADGGEGRIPDHCRLVIVNSPVGNDIPREFYQLAVNTDSVLGVHPYTRYWRGVRDPWDWIYHSGRWAENEAAYGLRPTYAFTECGPYAGSAEGWRHPDVLAGDLGALVDAMVVWWQDCAKTAAYREGRISGPGAWFTSGHVGWEFYQLDTPELVRLAEVCRELWHPGEYDVDAELKAKILEHVQAIEDLLTPDPVGPPPPWYETRTPPYQVRAHNPCGLYAAPGGALLRTLTDGRTMDVWERSGTWLRVTQAPTTLYWVKVDEVTPA